MKTIEIGPHKVQIYDSIYNMPPNRESLMSYYQLSEVGIGHTWEAIDAHLNGIMMAATQDDKTVLYQEIENLRLNYWSMACKYDPEMLSWMCMIHSIDGEPIDVSEDSLIELSKKLGEYEAGKEELWANVFQEVKKKFPLSFKTISLNGDQLIAQLI